MKLIYSVRHPITFLKRFGAHKKGHLETSIDEFSKLLYLLFNWVSATYLLISQYPSLKAFDILVIDSVITGKGILLILIVPLTDRSQKLQVLSFRKTCMYSKPN